MTGYTSLLVKTGRTTSYVTGDDGDLELGVARTFTVLDTGQYSGDTNISMGGFTEAHPNSCVQDNQTGLMWSKHRSLAPIGSDPYDKGPIGTMSWDTDVDGNGIWVYLAAANTAELSGYDDWRIPNREELGSIHSDELGTLYTDFEVNNWHIWTSTSTFNIGADKAICWAAILYSFLKTTQSECCVLLVRGSPTAPVAGGGGSLIQGMVD